MDEPLETLYCREVSARYGVWKDRYVPVPARIIEEKREGVWPVSDSVLEAARLEPRRLARLWLTGQVVPTETIVPDVAEAVRHWPSALVVGESGAGKTSVLIRLALLACEAILEGPSTAPLPLIVPLNRYNPWLSPFRFIARQVEQAGRQGLQAHRQLAPGLRRYLDEGRLLLLIDGLDELPSKFRRLAAGRWAKFIRRYGRDGRGNGIVLAARYHELAYSLGLPAAHLLPLTPQGQQELLNRVLEPEVASALGSRLGSPPHDGLSRLAGVPLYLHCIADIFCSGGEPVASRGRLLETWLTHLLRSKANWEEQDPADPAPPAPQQTLLRAFAEAAWKMSRKQGSAAVIRRSRLVRLLAKTAPPGERDRMFRTAEALFLAGEELTTAGREAADPFVWFKHGTLQAFFTARALQERFAAGRIPVATWRISKREEKPDSARLLRHNALRPLPRWSSPGCREEILLWAGLAPDASDLIHVLAKDNPLLAAECALEPGVSPSEDVRREVSDALIGLLNDKKTPLRMRIAAGDLLGRLGDPRLDDTVPVPAGEVALGDNRSRHRVELPGFHICKYPVTRAQFAEFVASDAYNHREWWTRAGWNWCETARATVGRRDPAEVIAGRPNHPMTGVTWYEAVAYANWFSSLQGVLYRLPTEAEWERAARGAHDYLFPWGDDPDPDRANTCTFDTLYVFDTTPVGIYPLGSGPFGACDQAGNVWEWCSTRYLPYPYEPADGREGLQGDDARVLRGGSWLVPLERARCSVRTARLPDEVRPDVGFRLVLITSDR